MTIFLWHFIRKLIVTILLCCGIVVVGILYYLEFELPDIQALNTVQLQVPLQIFTRDHKLIAQFGEKRRIPLSYDKIPPMLINAVLATEDQRYFQHPGIDLPGLARAGVKLIVTGRKEEGGSTITMQVARSFYLTRKKTFGRKLREILLALKIDHQLSKQKILELYLNKIFLGNRAYGMAAAALTYYGKPIDQLSVDQYAMLAGLPKAPSALNPIADPDAAKKRRDHVLLRMYELGYINSKTYKTALAAPIDAKYHDPIPQIKAPYAAELVRSQLEAMYGDIIYTDGFDVYTTIDSTLQEAANQAVRDNLIAYDQRHGYRGPLQNLGTPDLMDLENWEETLNEIPTVNGLEPAAVIQMSQKSITVLRSNGIMSTVSWKGLSWARRQIDADYLGRMPQSPRDILKLGDVIYIMATPQGFRLAQIPKAEAGLVSLNPNDGGILAMVGGFDYQTSKFNRVTTAERQPGSSFKPFIYAAAFDKGFTLSSLINDAPIVVENMDNTLWRPQNTNHRFYGPTRLRDALVQSRNLVSIRLLSLVGVPYVINYAERFGFSKPQLPPGLSLALGTALVTPLQMATAYSVFANSGFKIEPFIIDNIRDSQGKILYQAKPLVVCKRCKTSNTTTPVAPRIISEQTAFLITSAMHDVIQRGTATKAKSLARQDLAGKTGTTNNQVDAWFAGFNDQIVTIAWLGFDQQQQSLHEYGAQAALPMWIQFMQVALKAHPDHTITQPPGIVSVRIDPTTGKRTNARSNTMFEYYMTPYLPEKDDGVVSVIHDRLGVAPLDENIDPAADGNTDNDTSTPDSSNERSVY